MYYVILGTDVAGSLEKRIAARPEHLARLTQVQDEGRLLTAGPLPAIDSDDPGDAGFTGSIIIAEFESLSAAQQLSLIHISEPTRQESRSRMPSSA